MIGFGYGRCELQTVYAILAYELPYTTDKLAYFSWEIETNAKNIANNILKFTPGGKNSTWPDTVHDPLPAENYKNIIVNNLSNINFKARLEQIGAILSISGRENASPENKELCKWFIKNYGSADWLKKAAQICNYPELAFTIGLGKTMGIMPEYCFYPFPSDPGYIVPGDFPIIGYFKEFSSGSTLYKHTGTFICFAYNGAIIHKVLRYSSPFQNIFVFACHDPSLKNCLRIGTQMPAAILHNHVEIANNQGALVVLALNQDVLANLLTLFNEAKINNVPIPIVAGVFGAVKGLEAMRLSDIHGHRVIIACSPDCEEYAKIAGIANRCKNNGATEVLVYPYPIIGDYCWTHFDKLPSKSVPFLEQELIDIRAYERITKVFEKIENKAMSIVDLKKWETRIGLRIDENAKKDVVHPALSCQSWTDIVPKNVGAQLSMRDFFNPAYTTLIHGFSGTAKSWIALGIAVAAATGREFLGLKASSPVIVVYMDGEIGVDISNRILQLSSGFSPSELEMLNKNLKIIKPEDAENFLSRKDELIELLKQEKAGMFVLDNIFALCPSASRGNNGPFFQFIRIVKSMNIAPVVVHHNTKDKKDYCGTSLLGDLVQNIFGIKNVKDPDYKGMIPDEVSSRLNQDGPLIEITLEKEKIAPYWNNKSVYYYLPIGGTWEQLTDWPAIQEPEKMAVCASYDSGSDSDEIRQQIEQLPPDERKVMKFLLQHPGGVKRKEIDEATGWSEEKSLNLLNLLLDKQLIQVIGTGKATFYKLA